MKGICGTIIWHQNSRSGVLFLNSICIRPYSDMSKLPIGPVPLLDPRALLARRIAVDDYFDINRRRIAANKGGVIPTDAQLLLVLRGIFTETPTLDQLVHVWKMRAIRRFCKSKPLFGISYILMVSKT